MPKGLTYADAVRLLGGSSPFVRAADTVLGGALALATGGGSDVALSLFDAKTEVIRLGHLVAGQITETVRGLGRHDRSRRLQAAHGVLVVTAFFEALDDCLGTAGLAPPGFGRDDQIMLAARTRVAGDWPERLLAGDLPVPSPAQPYDRFLRDLEQHFDVLAVTMIDHLAGLAVWDGSDERTRRAVTDLLHDRLPERAVQRYEEAARRLAAEVPEFAIWTRLLESRAAARGLEALEAALLRVTSHRDPVRHRAALATAYRAELDRPILGGDVGDLLIPALGAAYVDPRFRVKPAGAGSRPAEEEWWDTEPRGDFAGFLATYVTTPQAADAPMLLLGQPGAGKSSLTRILAARLPAADFLVVRVALREVPAEAEIQDQVEQALRRTIGETVSWADLARDADGALPVILLDGFDELLQATGIHQSDYLQRVAAFQHREAVLGRPVAVLVTSRVAVADRARLPTGGLAVRLEPFDDPQRERWLAIWNAANADRLARAGRRPLPVAVLRRFPDLASQPLLLLMLALYDAAGNALQDDGESFDTGQLYERLLTEFADREVRRVHAGRPEQAMPELVEAELLRLSVVAFAMFHRLRLWATTAELDADLAGLGLHPSAPARTEAFRTPLTAGQEMVGRFFFIQRAEARRDEQTLQTYEFLHATFGEYLVARLVVQAVQDAAARANARTLRLGAADDDDLVQSLLGFTPLTARTTVLPFATALLRRSGSATLRDWLVERLRVAVTRPQYVRRPYQPVDKRIDHWMATYSFNLMLLTLACGEPVRATELFRHASDPADWLRGTALQWRAAVPSDMWLDAMETMEITRCWAGDGRRDLILAASAENHVADIDPYWSHRHGPDQDIRDSYPGGGFSNYFPLGPVLKSMHLINALSDDALRHVVEPLIERLPDTVVTFAIHGPEDAESIAHSLVRLWLASASDEPAELLLTAYRRAVTAVAIRAWGPPGSAIASAAPAIGLVLHALGTDAHRLPAADVRQLLRTIRSSEYFDARSHLVPVVECLLASDPDEVVGDDDELAEVLSELELLDDAVEQVRARPGLAARVAAARRRLPGAEAAP
ncbi:NACHT domain-containing protein [Actinoplanes sp. NPDC049599]|uniref:NACHT domain-containing protein n=1 Tax=Actinoplanes sp. NPDC049599 TaxID=3363903 RepID=UPI003797A054